MEAYTQTTCKESTGNEGTLDEIKNLVKNKCTCNNLRTPYNASPRYPVLFQNANIKSEIALSITRPRIASTQALPNTMEAPSHIDYRIRPLQALFLILLILVIDKEE